MNHLGNVLELNYIFFNQLVKVKMWIEEITEEIKNLTHCKYTDSLSKWQVPFFLYFHLFIYRYLYLVYLFSREWRKTYCKKTYFKKLGQDQRLPPATLVV